jgi:3-hydroxyacyl-[acyl-carrier-protein] dehydratase
MVEAIAQAGGALLLTEYSEQERAEKLMVFSGIEKAKFRRPVVPGDQLRIEVEVIVWRRNAARLQGNVFVGEKRVCEATISCRLVPRGKPDAAEAEA